MGVPKAVQRQNEEADRLMAEAAAKQKQGDTGTQPATPPQSPQVPKPVEPAPSSPSDEGQKPVEPTLEQKYEQLQKEHQAMKSRYSTLQGKYEKEIPRMLDAQKVLQQQVEELKARPAAPTAPAIPAYMRHLRKEDADEYDEKALRVIGDASRGVAEDLLAAERAKLQQSMTEMQQRLEAVNETHARVARREALNAILSKVETISPGTIEIERNSASNGFDEFLQSVEPLSGHAYSELAGAAIRDNDIQRLAQIVENFKTATGYQVQASEIASQVKPSKARGSAPPKPQEKRRIPASEISAFYQDKALKRLRCTPDEAKQYEREYDDAVREGRIDATK